MSVKYQTFPKKNPHEQTLIGSSSDVNPHELLPHSSFRTSSLIVTQKHEYAFVKKIYTGKASMCCALQQKKKEKKEKTKLKHVSPLPGS